MRGGSNDRFLFRIWCSDIIRGFYVNLEVTMNKYLKVALYVIGGIAVFVLAFIVVCHGCADWVYQVGEDLGGK